MENIFVVIVSGIIAIICSIVSYILSVKKAKEDQQAQIFFRQKYEYFLKLKYWAREFRGRLWHIDQRLFQKDEKRDEDNKKLHKDKKKIKQIEMINRFKRSEISKDLKWYFNDDISNGGYFMFSTIYMQCMLFCCMQKISSEYPYIPLKLERTNGIPKLNKKKNIYDFLKEIKYEISGKNGIPYGLIDSIGEFMIIKEKIMNYEEFCNEIIKDESRIKFDNVIFFWQNLCSSDSDIEDNAKVKTIANLFGILNELDQYDIDYIK